MIAKSPLRYSSSIKWDKIKWKPVSVLKFTPAGKHELSFPLDFPVLIKFFSFDTNSLITPNYHDYLEIGYVFQGKGILVSNGRDFYLKEGDLFIVGNTEFHTLKTVKGKQLKVFVLYFMPELIYRPGENEINMDYLKPFYDHSVEFEHNIPSGYQTSKEIFELMCKIYVEINRRNVFYKLSVKNSLQDILLMLVEYYSRRAVNLRAYNEKKANINRLRNVFFLLQEHYNDKITVKDAAKAAFMSVSYFCRYFKKVTGLTFTEYLLRVRIDRAKELLIKGDLQVTQVSYEVGFESHSYFDKIFKRFTHISPKDFAEKYSNTTVSSVRENDDSDKEEKSFIYSDLRFEKFK